MDELIDILNEQGKPSGQTCMKSFAHKNGIFHASAHIWIFDNHKNILIQKRTKTKDTFPNLWDISVAGHISAGEKPITSAIREIQEEIGLTVSKNQLHYINTFKKNIKHSENLIDNELHYIYLCMLNFNLSSLTIQKEEVADIKKIKLNDFIKEVNKTNSLFVPHGKEYFDLIFKAIQNFKYNIRKIL